MTFLLAFLRRPYPAKSTS